MTMCRNCKKYPLELREVNNWTDELGRDYALCDDCDKKQCQTATADKFNGG